MKGDIYFSIHIILFYFHILLHGIHCGQDKKKKRGKKKIYIVHEHKKLRGKLSEKDHWKNNLHILYI